MYYFKVVKFNNTYCIKFSFSEEYYKIEESDFNNIYGFARDVLLHEISGRVIFDEDLPEQKEVSDDYTLINLTVSEYTAIEIYKIKKDYNLSVRYIAHKICFVREDTIWDAMTPDIPMKYSERAYYLRKIKDVKHNIKGEK